jgi:hypothetical protein
MDSSLEHARLSQSSQVDLLLLSKALKARLFFLGVIELSNRRFVAPMSALLRCLMEVQYVVEALAKDSRWMSDLVAADERQRRRAMEKLLRLPSEDRAANVNDERIRSALAGIDFSAQGVSVREWAHRAGRQQDYELAYMLLSGDIHASLRGAESHLQLDSARSLLGLPHCPT